MKKNIAINLVMAAIFFLGAGTASANCVWTLHEKCEQISPVQGWTQQDSQCQDRKKPNAATAKCCCADNNTTGCCEITWSGGNISAGQETAENCQKKAQNVPYKFYPDGQANDNACTGGASKPIQINALIIDNPSKTNQKSEEEQAYSPLNYYAQVILPVPNSDLNQATTAVGYYDSNSGKMMSDLLAKYLKAVYDYGQMIAAILAAIILMGGGLLWLTSAGNDSKIAQAKELISGSVIGLVIVFSSYIILNTINPDLLKLKVLKTQVFVKTFLTPDETYANTLKSGIAKDNPLVCCQIYSDKKLFSCKDTAQDKCKIEQADNNNKTLSISTTPGSCENNNECKQGNKLHLCDGKNNGDKCSDGNGYCYGPPSGMNCYPGDGNDTGPCSTLYGALCYQNGCPNGTSGLRLTGGRNCGAGLVCCIADGQKGDTCGGGGTCMDSNLSSCPSNYRPDDSGGRNCSSGLRCCIYEGFHFQHR